MTSNQWSCEFIGYVQTFIFGCFFTSAFAVLTLFAADLALKHVELSSLLDYGKLIGKATPLEDSLLNRFVYWRVPKRWFVHFYITGLLSNALLLMNGVWPCGAFQPIRWSLVSLHLVRRTVECISMQSIKSRSSMANKVECESMMHVAHYAAGMAFYVGMPCAIWIDGCASQSCLAITAKQNEPNGHWLSMFLLFVWIFATVEQGMAHEHLRRLKTRLGGSGYELPTARWFQYVSCPHYTAEILIYWSLYSLSIKDTILWYPASLGVLVWVVCDLTVSAYRQHRWYTSQYSSKIPANWKRLVPFVF